VRKIIIGLTAAVLVSAGAWVGCSQAADEAAPAAPPAPATPAPAAPAAGGDAAAPAAAPASGDAGACCKADDTTPTLDLIKATPKGGLHNPYKDKIAELADPGHKKYMSAGCNGCHGGGGGGGMCPPLTNDTWVYGPDDDTLFRLIALGSDGLKGTGYHRVKQEVVVGPMPPFGGILKTSDDLWRIITWIRSVNPSSATKPPLQ
jgi:mono/diheme cytochrome c family protein